MDDKGVQGIEELERIALLMGSGAGYARLSGSLP